MKTFNDRLADLLTERFTDDEWDAMKPAEKDEATNKAIDDLEEDDTEAVVNADAAWVFLTNPT